MTAIDGQDAATPNQSMPFVISTAVEQIRSTMSANGALLAIRDDSELRGLASAGNVPVEATGVQLTSAFTRQCLNTGRVILCLDAQEDPLIHPVAARLLNLRSAIAVPIHFRESLIGIIQLFSSVPAGFNGTHIETLQEIGDLLAPVLASEVLRAAPEVEASDAARPVASPILPAAGQASDFGDDAVSRLRSTASESWLESPLPPPPIRPSRFFRAPSGSPPTEPEPAVISDDAPISPPPSASATPNARTTPPVAVPVPSRSIAEPLDTTSPVRSAPVRASRTVEASKLATTPNPRSATQADLRHFVFQTTPGRTLLIAMGTVCAAAFLYPFAHSAKNVKQAQMKVTATSAPMPAVLHNTTEAPIGPSSPSSVPYIAENLSPSSASTPDPGGLLRGSLASGTAVAAKGPVMRPAAASPSGGPVRLQEISSKIEPAASLPNVPATLPLLSTSKLVYTHLIQPPEIAASTPKKSPVFVAPSATTGNSVRRAIDNSPPDFVLDRTLHGHSNWVTGVAFTADGKHLASGSWDQSVKMWDVSTGLPVRTVGSELQFVQALAASRDGRYLAAENSRDTVTVWDAASGEVLHAFPTDRPIHGVGNNWVYSIAFSPDDRVLASGIGDKTVRLWDVQTGQTIRDLTAGRRSVLYVAFSPDGRYIATGGTEKSIIIWDIATGAPIRKLSGHKKIVYAVAFSPDGRFLASASGDKTVKVWDLQSGREVRSLVGHDGLVTTLAFSPDGRWLASGSWDKTIKIWDVESGMPLQTLAGNPRSIYSIAFDPRGSWLASGSEDGTIRLWRQHSASASRN
jgi:WD40 repeat protein